MISISSRLAQRIPNGIILRFSQYFSDILFHMINLPSKESQNQTNIIPVLLCWASWWGYSKINSAHSQPKITVAMPVYPQWLGSEHFNCSLCPWWSYGDITFDHMLIILSIYPVVALIISWSYGMWQGHNLPNNQHILKINSKGAQIGLLWDLLDTFLILFIIWSEFPQSCLKIGPPWSHCYYAEFVFEDILK